MRTATPHTPLDHFWAFVATYRSHLWTVLLYAMVTGLIGLATPVAVQALVGSAAFGTALQPIAVLTVLLFAGLVMAGVLKVLKAWSVEVLQRRLFIDTVARLAYVMPRLEVAEAGARGVEQPSHRFFELFALQKTTTSLLLSGVEAALAITVGLAVLAFYHPVLLAFDLGLVLALLAILFGLGWGGVPTAIEESSAKYRLASFFANLERRPRASVDRADAGDAQHRIDALALGYLQARSAHWHVVLRQQIGAVTTQALASAALLGIGGYLVIQRELTLGQLVAAELIVSAVVAALGDLGKHLESYYDSVSSVYKLDGLLDLVEDSEQELSARESQGEPS